MTSASIIGFDLVVILSLILGTLVLGTVALSSRVHRQSAWYGFMAPALTYNITLALSIGHQTDTGPLAGLCTFQAVLLYSIPGWVVVALGCFIITVYLELKGLVAGKEKEEPRVPPHRTGSSWLIAAPLLSFVFFLLLNGLAVVLDSKTPNATLNKGKLYCTAATRTGLYVGGAVMGVGMLFWVIILVKAGSLYRSHYSGLKKGKTAFDQLISIHTRAVAITISGSVAIGLYVCADGVVASYCLVLPGMIVFVVFGTQRDILESWAFWRKEPSYASDSQASTSSTHVETVTSSTHGAGPVGVWKNIGYNWNIGTKTQTVSSF